MTWNQSYCNDINLFVEGKILRADAERQDQTARNILCRLEDQAGVILADEVGMGKTFVALSVAISVALSDEQQRPVVVMIPSSLKEKWPKDFAIFIEKCLPAEIGKKIKCAKAESTVEFLKLLDDPAEKRKQVIFMTHGAFLKNMSDRWLRLAYIQRALYNRKNIAYLYAALYRYCPELLFFTGKFNNAPEVFEKLLNHKPTEWKRIILKAGLWEEDEDDPVPDQITNAIYNLPGSHFDNLYQEIVRSFPKRDSGNLKERLKEARTIINEALSPLWQNSLSKLSHSLPLLILDEAHHLKNGHTRIAKLFHSETETDGGMSSGQLENIFERMLFLTATPFQLGHNELCNVLERFNGIKWEPTSEETNDKEHYTAEIQGLRKVLDETQESAIRFDAAWENLSAEDFKNETSTFENSSVLWQHIISADPDTLPGNQKRVHDRYCSLKDRMKNAEISLKKYVIRHLRARVLSDPFNGMLRRTVINGSGIVSGVNDHGLSIDNDSILPFLLAARLSSINPDKRPVFAEGLASSYEAFLNTRKKDWIDDPLDIDEEYRASRPATAKEAEWYLSEIDTLVNDPAMSMKHPKINATIRKVLALWERGEKVLVFCHYIATGKSLHLYLSRAMKEWINERAALKLKCELGEAQNEIERVSKKFDDGYKLRTLFEDRINILINQHPELVDDGERIRKVLLHYFKTPSFLVRFFPLGDGSEEETLCELAFAAKDDSGLSFQKLIEQFLNFLSKRCGEDERNRYLMALNSVQTGEIRRITDEIAVEGVVLEKQSENTLPNVRLVTGSTDMSTRQNLMLTYNTPFYPDVLIATSVMAEGVDLHLNCRYIIHHDLSWNPSTIEQRTGRIDRIGAKVEVCGKSIEVYLPYVAATQDEKMYKVVMDRERWFNILMGEQYKEDFLTTERIAERIPLPDEIVKELMFRLEVFPSV